MPVVTSMVAVAIVWAWMFDPYYGLFNALLGKIGVDGPAWLGRSEMGSARSDHFWVYGRTSATTWSSSLPAFRVYRRNCMESAEIDGAGAWQKFRFVTMPLMRATTGFVLIMSTIKSFQVFGQVYVMTGGGPMNSTMVLVYYIYRQAL